MQGDKIAETSGKSGKLLGVDETETGTYWAAVRPDGTLYGEGQGIIMGKEGDVATWVGQGVGTIKKGGAVSYRGAVYYQSSSSRWSRLNSVAGVFEYEVDAEVRTRAEVHEWILTQVRQRPGCQDFSQEFRLLGNGPNWECIPTNCYDWDRASLEAFDQVVGDARRTFDLVG